MCSMLSIFFEQVPDLVGSTLSLLMNLLFLCCPMRFFSFYLHALYLRVSINRRLFIIHELKIEAPRFHRIMGFNS